VMVIGGGIIGAGIAEAATAHGLDVALVDRRDFASATSSASSKLIHGGLRYLQLGDVRLVREAHQERRYLMNVVAPHLVERLLFLFPLYRDGPHRPIVVRTGVLLYSALARARLNGRISEARALRLVPEFGPNHPLVIVLGVHQRAKADLQARTDRVAIELRKAHSLMVSSVARIAALDKAVTSAQLLIKATEQSIKGGVRINLDLLGAQQQLTGVQRDLAQARYGYLAALLRLRAAAGTLSAADVGEVAGYFR